MEKTWTAVDHYLTDLLIGSDPALVNALVGCDAAGLPAIAVSPPQGKLLSLMIRAQRARRILEIGTLGGYSAIWLARGLVPGGRLITLELDPKHAAVASANLAHAGLAGWTEVRVGPAAESLRQMIAEGIEPFDFVFIDADKVGYPEYLELVMKLVRPGSMIVADNVIRDGEVSNAASADPLVQAIRRYLHAVASDRRLESTAIQTVGSKGYDGLSFAVVTSG